MNDCLKEPGEFLARLGDVAAEHIYLFRHLRTPVGDRRNPLVNSRAKPARYATHSLRLDGTWQAFWEERLSTSHEAGNRRRLRRL